MKDFLDELDQELGAKTSDSGDKTNEKVKEKVKENNKKTD
jgi:hypothetical protein